MLNIKCTYSLCYIVGAVSYEDVLLLFKCQVVSYFVNSMLHSLHQKNKTNLFILGFYQVRWFYFNARLRFTLNAVFCLNFYVFIQFFNRDIFRTDNINIFFLKCKLIEV